MVKYSINNINPVNSKCLWSLPPYKPVDFMDYLESTGINLEEFRQLPVCKFAVKNDKIVDEQWIRN
ncbi:hypothetical protein I0Q91_03400 [Halanaerobiaceae bacterium Z-7014]|uniref:Uncharacterized protein n=1 Tax=Halonatronomonas betaini TaxID=2778430 RepID=A0A931ANM9_9FIRM|nr:hypothetical protein [Halonatronomonas betaini]MBF8436113.1 hypothetical protein [Halonatronomonas betaini]